MNLLTIQSYLRANQIDGWLLYDFRGLNPVALHVAGLAAAARAAGFSGFLPRANHPG